MSWKPTSEDWRNIAVTSADLALRVAEMTTPENEDDVDFAVVMESCARAAELLHQSRLYDYDDSAEVVDETAASIHGGTDGWEAARKALKKHKIL